MFLAVPFQLNKQAISSFLAHQKQVEEQFVEEWLKHGSRQNTNSDVTGLKLPRVYHTDVNSEVTNPIKCTESGRWKCRMKGDAGKKTLGHLLCMGFD